MTLMEVLVAVIALSAIVTTVCIVLIAKHTLPLARRGRVVLHRSDRTLRRLNRVAGDLEYVSHDFRVMEARVARTAHALLDQIDPPLRVLSAVLTGTRAGIGALFSHNGDGRSARHDHKPHRRHDRLHRRERSRT
jgi:hypothetical protein